MVLIVETPTAVESPGALRVVVTDLAALTKHADLLDQTHDHSGDPGDIATWPEASSRPTTVGSARALRGATNPVPAPEPPDFEPNDGLGI